MHDDCRQLDTCDDHCDLRDPGDFQNAREGVRILVGTRNRVPTAKPARWRIQLTTPCSDYELGETAPDGLSAEVTLHQSRCLPQVAWGGSVAAAEAYMAGHWSADHLVNLFRIFCRNIHQDVYLSKAVSHVAAAASRLRHWTSTNTRAGSRRNIARHYDLGNEFFSLFLDSSLMYSSALFEEPHLTLETAAEAKLDRICRALDLRPGDHVVEIGSGWGGFAIHAARNYGCRVTTTTISRNQYDHVRQRVAELGLGEQVRPLQSDYRDLVGQFDKLVSIEMIEAVGHRYLRTFFGRCDQLLRPTGRMLIQAITMPDQRYEEYRRSVDFIQRYIFPGGHLPSVGAMQQAVGAASQLQLVECQQFPESYALTLREWRRRFHQRLEEVRQLGFDEAFIRLWDYYFAYCEAAFLERAVTVGQFVWEKPKY